MSTGTEHKPPMPRGYNVACLGVALAVGLLFVDSMEGWWGIEHRWAWFPHGLVSASLLMATNLYFLSLFRFRYPGIRRPFAPLPRQRKVFVILASFAVFAAVVLPSTVAVAHEPAATCDEGELESGQCVEEENPT